MNAYRFRIPLAKPIVLKGKPQQVREGILLEQNGRWAEASPLPGFSTETIDDVIAALRGRKAGRIHLSGKALAAGENESAKPTSEPVASALRLTGKSLLFALSALERPITSPVEVPFNVLLAGNYEDVLVKAEACGSAECRAAKLKVGRGDVDADIRLVKEVRERLPENVSLRLDANQAWTIEQATTFLGAISDIELEYIEEPLQDATELESLYARTGVRYALDETLLTADSLDRWPNAAALVCKPTILGGRKTIESLAATGKPIVFSAAFESGVGIARIMQLAAEFSPNIAAGLDTLEWLEDDLLTNSPTKKSGLLAIEGEPLVDTRSLEAIAI